MYIFYKTAYLLMLGKRVPKTSKTQSIGGKFCNSLTSKNRLFSVQLKCALNLHLICINNVLIWR